MRNTDKRRDILDLKIGKSVKYTAAPHLSGDIRYYSAIRHGNFQCFQRWTVHSTGHDMQARELREKGVQLDIRNLL